MALAELIELLSWILVMSLGLSQSADCRTSSRLGLSLELGELQGVLSPDSSRPVKFSVCKSIWETSDPFLDLVLEISVSDQVKKAVTNRPRSSPVTGQRSILWKASRSDHCTPPRSQFANHTYPMDTTHPNSLAFWQVEAVLICSSLAKS
ncbi:hypothetical protein Q9966_012934 [Columba livia]|nr:hypothetical protein Q9966_012934 [Columba livia]